MSDTIILTALDGSNPLAFMAAVGTLRLLQNNDPEKRCSLRWIRRANWVPEISGLSESAGTLSERLLQLSRERLPAETFAQFLGKNITVDNPTYKTFVERAYAEAREGSRGTSDFAAAFGSEVCKQQRKERMEYTAFCFITGSGHQHFLGTMAGLKENVKSAHIQDALFGSWTKNKGLSMRWDPADAAEYALRWGDPSAEGASSVWGANLLAIHALPLLPSHATSKGLRTTGFGNRSEFTWPIWTHFAGLGAVASLLSLAEIQKAEKDLDHRGLRAFGIEEIYRASRVRIGQGANFKVSFRPARGV